MDVLGEAGVYVRALDTGFSAELKAKVEAASLQAKASVPIGADPKVLDAELAKIEARVKTAALKARSDVLIGADSKRLDAELVRIDASVKAAMAAAKSDVVVGVDAKRMDAELLAVETKVKAAVKASEAKVPINLDTAAAEASVGRLQGVIGNFVSASRSHLESFAGEGNLVTKSLKEVESAGLASTEALKVGLAGGVVAVGAAVAFMAAEGVKHFQEMTAEVRGFQRVTGVSAEDASRLVFALGEMGIGADQASTAMARFGRTLDLHADTLTALGIQVVRNKDGNIDMAQSLLSVADAYQKVGPGAEGDTIALTAFGRAGAALIPVLQRGREGLKEFYDEAARHGLIFSDEDLQKGRELTLATRDMKAAFEGLEIQLAKGIIPALTGIAHGISAVTDAANTVTAPVGGVGGAISGLWTIVSDFTPLALFKDHVKGSNYELTGWAGTVENIAARVVPGFGLALDLLGHKHKDNTEAMHAQVEAASALGVELSDDEVATGKLTDTTKKAIDAAAKHALTMTDEARSIGLSSEALASAIGYGTKVGADGFKDEEAAAKAFTAAVIKAGDATRAAFAKDFSLADTFSASNIEAEAKKQADAVSKLADAQQHLTDVQAKLAQSSQVTTAESISLRDATAKVGEISEKVTKTQAEAEAKADALAAAQQHLADVQGKLNEKGDATLSQQNELRDALDKVADAQKAVGVETQLSTKLLDDHTSSFYAAKVALVSLIKEGGNLSPVQKQIVNFYEDSLIEAKSFSDNVRTAIKEGYDPQLISELLQKGPKEAGPLLQQLVNDHTGRLRDMVNASQSALNEISTQAAEMARLTQLAVSSHSDVLVKDLKNAMAIAQAEAETGGKATAQALSVQLGIGVADVKRIMGEFGINVDQATQQAADVTATHMQNLASVMDRSVDEGANTAAGHLFRFRDTVNETTGAAAAGAGFQTHALADNMIGNVEYGTGTTKRQVTEWGSVVSGVLIGVVQQLTNDAPGNWNPLVGRAPGGGLPQADGGIVAFAKGGRLARDSEYQPPGTMVQWAEPETEGEYHAFIPRSGAKRQRAAKVLQVAAEDLGYEMLPKAKFVYGGLHDGIDELGLAQPPSYKGNEPTWPTSDTVTGSTYEEARVWMQAAKAELARRASARGGGGYGFQALIDYINGLGIDNTVTSTTGGEHVEGSLHYLGLAADFVGDMGAIAKAFVDITPSMQELFHDPLGFSVKGGRRVDWTLGDHWDHVHAASWGEASEGPGIPRPGGGDYGGDAASWINQALTIDGEPQSWFQGIYDRMMQESGGQNIPQAIHDINTDLGTPAFGPMQIIEPTFNAYAAPGHGDWHNPVDSTAAAINYIAARYGDPYHLPSGGYAKGGFLGPTGDPFHVGTLDQGGTIYPGWNLNYNGTGSLERVPSPLSAEAHHDGINLTVTIPIQSMSFGPGTDAASLSRTVHELLVPAITKALEETVRKGELGRLMHDHRMAWQ